MRSDPHYEDENNCFQLYKFVFSHSSDTLPIIIGRDSVAPPPKPALVTVAIFIAAGLSALRLSMHRHLSSFPLPPLSSQPDTSMSFSWFLDFFSYLVCITPFPKWAILQRNCEIPPSL